MSIELIKWKHLQMKTILVTHTVLIEIEYKRINRAASFEI